MKKFLRLIGNIGIIIIAFIGYSFIQLMYVIPNKTKLPLWNGIGIAVITVMAIWVMFALYKYQLKQENNWDFNEKPHWSAQRILIAIGMFFLMTILQILFIQMFAKTGVTSQNQQELDKISSLANPIYNVLLVIVAPICEEIIFRGMFFNTFFPVENHWTKFLGILASGFVFGFMHDPTFSKFIFLYWMMGSLLAWTYVLTKDLRYSIIAHMLNNLLPFL